MNFQQSEQANPREDNVVESTVSTRNERRSNVKLEVPGTGFLCFDGRPIIVTAVFSDGALEVSGADIGESFGYTSNSDEWSFRYGETKVSDVDFAHCLEVKLIPGKSDDGADDRWTISENALKSSEWSALLSSNGALEPTVSDTRVGKGYRVHLYAVVRVPYDVPSAASQLDAIATAQEISDLHRDFARGAYAEQIVAALVDEVGDSGYFNTRNYVPGMETEEWVEERAKSATLADNDQQTIDRLRQALEVIAVGDTAAAKETATAALEASGIWTKQISTASLTE